MAKVPINKLWVAGERKESIETYEGHWLITDLQLAVKDLPKKKIPLEHIDFSTHNFANEDIYDFAQHVMHINDSNPDVPIIMDHKGRIIDGRHRLVKALIEGREWVWYKRLTPDIHPTTNS